MKYVQGSRGAMDSALDFGSRGCGFESHRDRFFFFSIRRSFCIVPIKYYIVYLPNAFTLFPTNTS